MAVLEVGTAIGISKQQVRISRGRGWHPAQRLTEPNQDFIFSLFYSVFGPSQFVGVSFTSRSSSMVTLCSALRASSSELSTCLRGVG